jgi:hypothetical protein
MNNKLFILLIAALVLVGSLSSCKFFDTTPLGLEQYEEDAIKGTPTNETAKGSELRATYREITSNVTKDSINDIFNNTDEPGNIIGEIRKMDELVKEINDKVNQYNEERDTIPDYRIIDNPDGSLTLPYFSSDVDINYLVNLQKEAEDGSSKYAGYLLSADKESVVTFHTDAPYTWEEGPGQPTVIDHTLFYGKKVNDTDIKILSATLGINSDTGDIAKGWSFDIDITGESYFTATHNDSYYTHSIAGKPKGEFLVRIRETDEADGVRDLLFLYDYNGGNITQTWEYQPAEVGEEITVTDISDAGLSKPDTISDAMWKKMVKAVSSIADPDGTPHPQSTEIFNNSFIKSKF